MTISHTVTNEHRLREHASQQIRANQLEAATATLGKLIELAPDDIPACLELANILSMQGRWCASSAPLLHAIRHLPRHAPLLLKLTQQLIHRGEVVAARQCLDFLGRAPHPPSDLLLAQAHLRFSLGEIVSAKALVEQALEGGADDPDDHYLYAMTLQFTGAIDTACRVLIRCLQRWPHYGDAAVVLANLHKQSPKFDLLSHIEKQLGRLPQSPSDPGKAFIRADFEYARFKLLDDVGRHDDAWSSLARCNILMHRLNPYDADEVTATTDALVRMHDAVSGMPAEALSFDGPVPIFIVGMPRSGTTLLDRMLSSHSQITTAGEIFDFWQQLHYVANVQPANLQGFRKVIEKSVQLNFREIGERYLQQTQWRAGKSRFYIDKLPANIQMVAFIRQALPHAPIVHISRPPMDVCFSNFKAMFGNTSAYSYEQEALAHYYQQYSRLVTHWHTMIPDAMLDVSYASLVSQPQSSLQRILAHCGLEMEPACLHPERNTAPVATPSNAQVREPIHTHGNDHWRNYGKHLEPLRKALIHARSLSNQSSM